MRTRSGQLLDTSSLLLEILELLERQAEDGHKPGFAVWSALIDRLSKAAKHDESLWSLAQRAFKMLLREHSDKSPSTTMLKIGLKTCEATTDAELAAQLVSLVVNRSESLSFDDGPPLDSTTFDVDARSINIMDGANDLEPVDEPQQISPDSKVPPTGAPIPIQQLRKAFEISLGAGDMRSASSILSSFDKLSPYYPLSAHTEFYALGLLGFAKAGDADSAKSFLKEMKRKEMKPR
jgi:pentatricopeptide repeat protein